MSNIRDLHKSLTFTILIIIFSSFGIIFSLQYSKYNIYIFKESIENSSYIRNEFPITQNEFRRIELDINRFEYSEYPIGSVPIKVVLGKIEKIENSYLPQLYLSFMETDKNIISLNTH